MRPLLRLVHLGLPCMAFRVLAGRLTSPAFREPLGFGLLGSPAQRPQPSPPSSSSRKHLTSLGRRQQEPYPWPWMILLKYGLTAWPWEPLSTLQTFLFPFHF